MRGGVCILRVEPEGAAVACDGRGSVVLVLLGFAEPVEQIEAVGIRARAELGDGDHVVRTAALFHQRIPTY